MQAVDGHRMAAGACRLPEYVAPGALLARAPIAGKDVLFRHFAEVFANGVGLPASRICDALWEREQSENTAVGRGVALPHATLPEAERTYVGVFTTGEPIDYGQGAQPVDVFFVTISPPDAHETHLRLLSRIAALTLKTDLLRRLREAQDPEDMRSAIERCTDAIEG